MSPNSYPESMPIWLAKSLESNQRLTGVLRTLASREWQRVQARQLSETLSIDEVQKEVTSKKSSWPRLFRKLTSRQEPGYKEIRHYSTIYGGLEDNLPMNRYSDILPYDRTRFSVNDPHSDKKTRYLNANWVAEKYGHKWWIASQAPLRNTAHAFLSVFLHEVRPPHVAPNTASPARVRTVVQLTRNIESGRRKADAYFPTVAGESRVVYPEEECDAPALRVTLLETKSIREAHCVQSKVSIIQLNSPSSSGPSPSASHRGGGRHIDGDINGLGNREIVFTHLLYLAWPDHGVPDPEDRETLLAFAHLVNRVNRDKSNCFVHQNPTPDHACAALNPDPPILIGCSAGIGRTGSFIALSSLMREYNFLPPVETNVADEVAHSPLGAIPKDIEDDLVLQEIDSLREQRPGMVQKNEQAVLVYEILGALFH
ncbi:hypothetical protein D9619_002807 [Psilocybe cf. subviscida]|uniref:Uncharacterized protein n=1 Tax=Psilocybe cf. subviscida TaxID=2480587 RepID=A0A8H5EU08_9AGAR|nr:hypothetical protein D9619_002807 [Psilocybe cf. subviscida]